MCISNHRFVSVALRVLLLGVIFVPLGCGQKQKATVSGTVTYKGTPLTSGTVTFYGSDNQVVSGSIDTNGAYSIAGVPVGPAKISVITPPAPSPKQVKGGVPGGDAQTNSVQIPKKYELPDQSGLTYTVVSGSQEHPIELK